MKRMLIVSATPGMIKAFLVPHIKYLEEKGVYVECASSPKGDAYGELVKELSVRMNPIPVKRSPYNLENIKAVKRLCALIKEGDFDTVFCHSPTGGVVGRLAGRLCGRRVIYMAHGFHFWEPRRLNRYWLLYYNIEKFMARFTDILITINEEDFKISSRFKAKRAVKLPGIGIDTEKFTPQKIGGGGVY